MFLKPLKAQQLLEPLAIASLFSNILYIISINEELIGGLVKLQGQSPAQICVGSLFLSLVRVSCSAVPSDDAVLVVVDLAYAFGRRYSSPTISKCMYSTVPISRQHYQRLSRTRNKTSTIAIAICDLRVRYLMQARLLQALQCVHRASSRGPSLPRPSD